MPTTRKDKWKGYALGVALATSVFALSFVASLLAQPTGTNTIPVTKVPLSTVANLPSCIAGNEGLTWGVTDQATAVAYNGAVTGSGTTHQKVYCNGTAWVQQ